MIQRIQTVYLVTIIILTCVMCKGSLISIQSPNASGSMDIYNLNIFYFNAVENGSTTHNDIQFGLIAIAALQILLTAVIIFSFKDRPRQMKLVRFNFLVMFMLVAGIFSKAVMDIPTFSFSKMFPYSIFGFTMMVMIIYLNWRVLMLIKRDDEMVKSADRIR